MLLSDAFDRMKLHVDLLPRPQLREHDVLVRRPRQVAREDGLLFALWNPHQVAAGDFIVLKLWVLSLSCSDRDVPTASAHRAQPPKASPATSRQEIREMFQPGRRRRRRGRQSACLLFSPQPEGLTALRHLQITIDQFNMRKDSVSREALRYEEFEGCVELKRIRDWFICAPRSPLSPVLRLADIRVCCYQSA